MRQQDRNANALCPGYRVDFLSWYEAAMEAVDYHNTIVLQLHLAADYIN